MIRLAVPLSSFFLLALLVLAQPGLGQSGGEATPAITPAPNLASVPSDCGILAEPIGIDPLIPRAVGAWPIWVALPNWEGETKGILVMPDRHEFTTPLLEGWWTTKVAWFISKSYSGEVRLRGYNIADHSPMVFEFSDEPRALATLNPAQPGGFVEELDQWAFFPSHVWVSGAGCYRLEAEWDGGLWQQVIAVGSRE